MSAVRSGDLAPLVLYAVVVVVCLGLVLNVGGLGARMEAELRARGRGYRRVPSWAFRYWPLAGLALVTVGLLVLT